MVNESAQLSRYRNHFRLAVNPADELDPVATHIHKHPPACKVLVPEPPGMWSRVLLALPHYEDVSKRLALISQLLGTDVLWHAKHSSSAYISFTPA